MLQEVLVVHFPTALNPKMTFIALWIGPHKGCPGIGAKCRYQDIGIRIRRLTVYAGVTPISMVLIKQISRSKDVGNDCGQIGIYRNVLVQLNDLKVLNAPLSGPLLIGDFRDRIGRYITRKCEFAVSRDDLGSGFFN